MIEFYLMQIKSILPESVMSHRVIADGAANLVFEINDQWIFRFSRGAFTSGQMKIETAFLPQFEKVSPIAVPSIKISGESFMGYPKMIGTPLRASIVEALSEQSKDNVAAQLGTFLKSLHRFKFSHEKLSQFPYGGSDFWKEVWPLVAPLLSTQARVRAEEYFKIQLEQQEKITPVITHSDLGTSNILFDDHRNQIAGIIDFGDISLHDPARDFNGLLRNHGRQFTEKVLLSYANHIDIDFWKRIEFFAIKHYAMLVFYAPNFGLEPRVPAFIEQIEKAFTPAV